MSRCCYCSGPREVLLICEHGSCQPWARRRRAPDCAARVLLTVIDRDPEVVERALGERGIAKLHAWIEDGGTLDFDGVEKFIW